jgi:ATP-dependent 26S proteasome regulatory subunit
MTNQNFVHQIEQLIRARAPLIVVESVEERRAVKSIKAICESSGWPVATFDIAEGFHEPPDENPGTPAAKDPVSMLDQLEKRNATGVYVLKDFHECWGNPQVKRKLRNVVQRFKYVRKTLVVTCPAVRLPEELRDEAVVLAFPLPGVEELSTIFDNLAQNPQVKVTLTRQAREKLIRAATGLTASQAERAFATAIIQDGIVDDRAIGVVLQEKKRAIAESKALQFYDVSETPDEVGGLAALKQWLELRERAFTPEAQDFGLPPPKGIALIGIPGTGKSLTAKLVASQWKVPLLRLDAGSLFGSLLGESETNLCQALRVAEMVAPCVLWIDELEKAMAQDSLDGGTSHRVFGTFLTWMAEKTAPCFVVATANDISRLPPELLRKGRFDEVFFLDLPTAAERRDIFEVHLKKRGRQPKDFDLKRLAQASEGYVGSELEQAVIDALYVAFNEGRRDLKTEDIVNALKAQVPLSVSQRETIENLRQWLREGRARAASLPEADKGDEPPPSTQSLDIRPPQPPTAR